MMDNPAVANYFVYTWTTQPQNGAIEGIYAG